MQLAPTTGGPRTGHPFGSFAIPFLHEWIRAQDITSFPNTRIEESLFYSLLSKEGAAKITSMLHQDGVMRNT